MSQQIIDTVTATDSLPSGFEKVNENFTELYASLISTGMVIDYFGSSAPSGWILLDGSTIGKSGSGATYANNDAENLFVLLWNSISNAYAPVSGGRGASASADFASGKTLTLPDSRGKVIVGKNTSTFNFLGQALGNETVTLSNGNLPSHSHDYSTVDFSTSSAQTGTDIDVLTNNFSTVPTSSVGSATPVSILQPSITANKIIKL